jgi:hypothetical protein
MKKIGIEIKLAIAAGLINCIAWYAMAVKLGFYNPNIYFYKHFLTIGLLLIGIFLSIFLIKKGNQNSLEFKEGLKKGLLYSVVVALMLGVFNYIYHTFISPDTIGFFVSEAKKFALENHLNEEQTIERAKRPFSSFAMIPSILFFGLIFSLLASAIFQKKKNTISSN